MVPCLYTRISILLSQLPILIPRFLGPIISSCSSPDSTAMLRSTLESVLFMIDDLSNTRHKHIIEGRTELHKLMANSRAYRLSSRRDPPQQSNLLRRRPVVHPPRWIPHPRRNLSCLPARMKQLTKMATHSAAVCKDACRGSPRTIAEAAPRLPTTRLPPDDSPYKDRRKLS